MWKKWKILEKRLIMEKSILRAFARTRANYSIPFLALKMTTTVHTGPELETKTNCQKRAELSDQAEVLADSG
jgi:hypothetical protein